MSEELFDLIFRGEIVKNIDEKLARKNVQQLFKIPAAKIDALFSGRPVVLKRGLNMEVANKYRVAIKKAGALVNIVAQAAPTQTVPAQQDGSQNRSQEKASNTTVAPLAEPGVAGLTMAPVGADVLNADEREIVADKKIDLSAFSVRASDGPLLDSDEIMKEVSLDIEVDWSVAPKGSELLAEDEKEHHEPAVLDLSALSLAEVGVTLVEAKEDTVRAPDVSHLSLKT